MFADIATLATQVQNLIERAFDIKYAIGHTVADFFF